MVASGEVVDVSGSVITFDMLGPAVVPTPPPPITLADILAATEVVTQKEAQDRAALESIGSIPFEALRMTLIQWAKAGFPNAYTLYVVAITPPDVCSDGVKRGLGDYITFLTGKTMAELIAPLQARCPDFVLSYATTGPEVLVVVSKA